MKVRFTPSARMQLLDALVYINRDDPQAALRFRNKVEKALRRLEEFPESGSAISEFPELPQREIIVPPYRIFYRIKGRKIWIVGVWHGAQLPLEP